MGNLQIQTPRWALPLLNEGARYLGAKGGRMSGKSHFFAELAVEEMIRDPHLPFLCVREVQKSIRFSAKLLIENKIRALGVSHMFDVQRDVIYRKGGDGLFVFMGMQDHTEQSVKSIEGFRRSWVEEAQNFSASSVKLLRPTIFRNRGAQMWFSWNPTNETDAIEQLLCAATPPDGTALVHVNYDQNPFLTDESLIEVRYDRKHAPDTFGHVWEGDHLKISKAQIFAGKWYVDEFTPDAETWEGPYHGLDFGFAEDPTAALRLWIHDETLFIEREAYKIGLELDDTAEYVKRCIPGIERYEIRADNARPESISYLKRHGLPRIVRVDKGKGSVEDGIEFMKSFKRIVIHPRCTHAAQEFKLYSYKIDNRSGEILPIIVDANNHIIDASRYGLEPIMKNANKLKRFKNLL